MSARDLTDAEAVLRAMAEYKDDGRDAFLTRHNFGPAEQYYVRSAGRLYEAKAIANVAYGYQLGNRELLPAERFSGGESAANAALRALGFEIVNTRPKTVEGERAWRLAVQAHFEAVSAGGSLEPQVLRNFAAYGGGQGIWVHAERTKQLDPRGVTVGVLNTGRHYADAFTEDDVLYHYPRTNRPGGRDHSEIQATKAAGDHRVPVFVISHPPSSPSRRAVRLGWVEGWDDASELFLISFKDSAPANLLNADHSDDEPFEMFGNGRRRKTRTVTDRPGQGKFKLRVLQRYGSRCPLSGVSVPEMLEAAHLVPHASDGTNDPRNGLVMNVALHRAFDAYLFAIHPDTHKVVTRPDGPDLQALGITSPSLDSLVKLPHADALKHRYEDWLSRQPRS